MSIIEVRSSDEPLIILPELYIGIIEKVQIQIFFATQRAANKWLGYKFCAPLFSGAHLIQNVCPVSEDYVDCQYMIENNTVPVTINDRLAVKINGIVRKVVRLNKRGSKRGTDLLKTVENARKNDSPRKPCVFGGLFFCFM